MSKKQLSGIFAFVIGASVGSAVTNKVVKEKYKKIAREEIDSVKKVFSKRAKEQEAEHKEASENPFSDSEKKEAMETAREIITSSGYISQEEQEGEDDEMRPYVIPPEELGADEYDVETLTYYADGVLADEEDNIIEDVDRIVGANSLKRFGEYEDDSVFVRNEETERDYEILIDYRKYHEVYAPKDM